MVFRHTCNADIAQAMFSYGLTGSTNVEKRPAHELDKQVSKPEHILTLVTSLPKQSFVLTNTDNKVHFGLYIYQTKTYFSSKIESQAEND